MPLQVACIDLADGPATGRLAGFVHALPTSRHQVMPFGKRLVRRPQTVGAGLGEPVEFAQTIPVEDNAIADPLLAVRIVAAAAVAPVEQFASDIGRVKDAGVFVLKLVDAAAAAAVAQRFPL